MRFISYKKYFCILIYLCTIIYLFGVDDSEFYSATNEEVHTSLLSNETKDAVINENIYSVPSLKDKLNFSSPLEKSTLQQYYDKETDSYFDGRFGELQKQDSALKTDKFHIGIDLTTENETDAVYAVQNGIVSDVWYEPGKKSSSGFVYSGNSAYGGLVVINHENGVSTLYGRLGEVVVKEGQYVSKGEIIAFITRESAKKGLIGANEMGYHLHFEILVNPFDPNIEKLELFETNPVYEDILQNKSKLWVGISNSGEFGYRNTVKNASGGDLLSQDFHRGNDITTVAKFGYIYSILAGTVDVHYVMNDYIMKEFEREGKSKSNNAWVGHSIYGGLVVLKHSDELFSLYGHMSFTNSSVVKENSKNVIPKGSYLGIMGSTGLSTGAHLHFSMMINPATVIEF